MAVVRTNPLPVGRYWIDVFTPAPDGSLSSEPTMIAWLAENGGRVRVVKTETFPGTPLRTWRLFEVRSHPVTAFPFTRLGFPTKATGAVQSSDDTVQKPPPEKPDWGTLAIGSTPLLMILAGAAVFALAARK